MVLVTEEKVFYTHRNTVLSGNRYAEARNQAGAKEGT